MSHKIDFTTFPSVSGTTPYVSVGTTLVDLVEYTAPSAGRYLVLGVLRQSGASAAGCITTMEVQVNGVVNANIGMPTVKNYAGNEQVTASINSIVTVAANDVISISTKKDRTNFTPTLGCVYSIATLL